MIAASPLSRFQDDFARALFADGAAAGRAIAALAAQPGFAVYRNTVMTGCIDALQANFPAVTRLVGEEWMRAAAAVYARAEPPRDPRLMCYGEGFPAFLAGFEPAQALPYLPGVARLDYFWCEAHVARDEPGLAGGDVAALAHQDLACAGLRPHPAARWAWFEDAPIATIWSANRDSAAATTDLPGIAWRGDGVLIARPGKSVIHVAIDRAAHAFLDACGAGQTVEQAMLASLGVDPQVDFTRLMALLVEAGAFAGLTVNTSTQEQD